MMRYVAKQKNTKNETNRIKKVLKEEVRKVLNEAQEPLFKAKHKDNNLVAAIAFLRNKFYSVG